MNMLYASVGFVLFVVVFDALWYLTAINASRSGSAQERDQ